MRAVLQPNKESHALTLSSIPVPVPQQPGDILVKVNATCPCAGELDWALWAPDFIPATKTPIPGQDLAGTVVSTFSPASESRFKPGDEVYARIEANRPGAAAEYVIARERELALRPRGLSWTDTAATPISALTGYQSLFARGTLDAAGLQGDEAARRRNAAQRVLVAGASGGVGAWAVQLARAAGAGSVVGVCGAGSAALVKSLGADEIVDYGRQSLAAWAAEDPAARECDLVVDCVGGATLAHCWTAVKEGGRLVSVCATPEESRPEGLEKQASSLWFVIDPLGTDLDVIRGLVEEGTCRPIVDSVFEFEEYAKAWEKVEGGHAKGKVVLKVNGAV